MKMWIVCWVAEGNMPGCDVFTEKEQAMQCLNFMMETGKTAVVRSITLQKQEPQPEAVPDIRPEEESEKEEAAEGQDDGEV